MKFLVFILVAACSILQGRSQIVFYTTNLPARVGIDYYRAYFNASGTDVSTRLGKPGGPQRWNFSQPGGAGEIIRRTDIVAPSDRADSAAFASSAYAERDTREASGERSWSFYRLSDGVGRIYAGFYDANANATCPCKVFDQPTVELPDGIYYGRTWTRTVDFRDCVSAGGETFQFDVHFTSQSEVDAYGTLILPRLGETATLRVNEVNTYDVTLSGFPITTQSFRNYYWLVRGIGKAVLIGSEPSSTVPPADFTTARTFLRVFESNTFPPPYPVSDLGIQRQRGGVVLNWREDANAWGYRIETLGNLASTNWQRLADPTVNTWSNAVPITESQRYFRVFAKP